MNKSFARTVLATAALAFLGAASASEGSSSAQQAVLSDIQGTVLVNQGERFVTSHDDTALKAGDRVLVMTNASAALVYADGCDLNLEPESMLTVGELSPCAGEAAQVNRIGPVTAQAVGASGARTGATAANNTAAFAVFGTGAAVITYLVVDGDLSVTEVPPPVSP